MFRQRDRTLFPGALMDDREASTDTNHRIDSALDFELKQLTNQGRYGSVLREGLLDQAVRFRLRQPHGDAFAWLFGGF